MAISAREMLLIVRAQNQASGALRRVARDVGSLSNLRGLRERGQQLRINEQNLRVQRQQAMYNEQSIKSGLRATQMEKARATQKLASMKADLAASGVQQKMATLEAQRLRNQAQIVGLEKQRPKLPHTQQMRDLRLAAANMDAKRLAAQEGILKREMAAATAAIQKQTISVKELSAAEAEAGRRAEYWASRQKIATERLALNAAKQRDLNRAIRDAQWDKVAAGGRIMQHTSRVMQYAGLAIGGALAFAAYNAAKFNTESTLAATQATNRWHQSARGVLQVSKQISKALLDMAGSGQTTAAMQDNQAAIYDIFSSMTLQGSQASQIKQGIAILRQFNQASIAGQVNIKDVSAAGITLLNNFARQGKQVQDLPKILNRMFAAVRFGRMTVTEFTGSLNQVAPAFSTAFGRSPQAFDQLSAAMATLTRQMPSVRMAATGLARLTEMFQRPDFVAGLKKSGVAITDAHNRLIPFNDIIDKLAKRFPALMKGGLPLANFFKTMTALGSGKQGTAGTIQGRRALQELILNQKQYHLISGQVINDNNEFDKSFKAMSNTSGVKWQLFTQQLHAFAIEIGTAVIPVITRLGRPIMQAVHWFNNLDDATKNMIGKWGAWAAAATLAAAAISFLGGTVLRLVALIGRSIGLFGLVTVGVIAAAAAISALSGNWDGLNGIIDTFVSYGTGSLAGWVTMLGLAAVAALKLRSAIMAVSAAQGAGGAAGAAGGLMGLLGGGRRLGGDLRAAGSLGREVGGLKGLLTGAGLAAAAIPGPLWIAGAAIAATAGGALLWKHHMEGVRKEAEAAARAMQNVQRIGNVPSVKASQLGTLGGAASAAQQAQINLNAANKAIRTARAKGVGGDALKQLFIDRYNAAIAAQKANANADRIFGSLSGSLAGQASLLQRLGKEGNLLKSLQGKRSTLISMGADKTIFSSATAGLPTIQDLQKVDQQIARVTARMDSLKSSATSGAQALARNFATAITNLGKLANVRISPTAIQDMFRFALKKGRMLTIPEIKAFVHAEVSPRALAKVRKDIAAAINAGERQRMIIAGKNSIVAIKPKQAASWTDALAKSPIKMLTRVIPPKNVGAVHNSVAKVFQKNIVQRITISPGPAGARARGVAIGAALATGAASGVEANTAAVIAAAVAMVDAAHIAAKSHAQIKSPSRLFADTVGKPIAQGIALGMLEARGDIVKAAALTVDIFQGSILSNFTPGKKATKLQIDRAMHSLTIAQAALHKKNTQSNRERVNIATESLAALKDKGGKRITPEMITKDLQGQLKAMRQFNDGLAKLKSRNVPNALIEQLSALGVSGSSNIAKLANMTKPQLDKYVALWKQANKEVTKSARYTKADVIAALKGLAKEAAQSLLDTYNGIKDTNTQNFGDLFGGAQSLADKTGTTFKDALDTYNTALADYQSQLGDLNNQVAKIQADEVTNIAQARADALAQAVSDMQSNFGQLFNGSWLQGTEVQTKMDWGIALGFDDLQKDLQSQVDKFNTWQTTLTALAGKVPKELSDQLAALGPDATANLQILNNATSDQLAQYIATWQSGQGAVGIAANKTVADSADLAKQIAGIQADTLTQLTDVLTQIDTVNKQIATLVQPTALTSGDLTKDIDGQISAWQEYQATLQTLIDKGLPPQLIQQLQNMGPTAEPYLKALVSMSDAQLLGKGGFVEKWQTANSLIVTATNSMMNTQLQIWYQYGANSAAQLIAGVSSQQGPLLTYFTNLFQNLLQGKTPTFTPTTGTLPGMIPGTVGSGSYDSSDVVSRYLANNGVSTNTYKTDMTVIAHQDESLGSTLERATFRLDNRNPQ